MDQADMARARQGNVYGGQTYPDAYGNRRGEESPYKAGGGGVERVPYHNR